MKRENWWFALFVLALVCVRALAQEQAVQWDALSDVPNSMNEIMGVIFGSIVCGTLAGVIIGLTRLPSEMIAAYDEQSLLKLGS